MKTAIAFGLLALLAACSTPQTTDPQIDSGEVSATSLMGAPGNSFSNGHLFNYTGPGIPNGHRAEVFARVASGTPYGPDTYIPTEAYFSVELQGHTPDQVQVSVAPNFSRMVLDPFNATIIHPVPITCEWQESTVICSRGSTPLPYNTLFRVTVQELDTATNQWVIVSRAYFRTPHQLQPISPPPVRVLP